MLFVFVALDSTNETTHQVSFYEEVGSDDDEKYPSPSPSPSVSSSPSPPPPHPPIETQATEQSNPEHGARQKYPTPKRRQFSTKILFNYFFGFSRKWEFFLSERQLMATLEDFQRSRPSQDDVVKSFFTENLHEVKSF